MQPLACRYIAYTCGVDEASEYVGAASGCNRRSHGAQKSLLGALAAAAGMMAVGCVAGQIEAEAFPVAALRPNDLQMTSLSGGSFGAVGDAGGGGAAAFAAGVESKRRRLLERVQFELFVRIGCLAYSCDLGGVAKRA
jgi:hypothetical protein